MGCYKAQILCYCTYVDCSVFFYYDVRQINKWNVSFLSPLQFIGICSLDFSGNCDLLEYLFLWKLFTFHDYISSQISALSTPYIFQTDSSFIAFKMIIFHHSTRHGITRLISTVHIMHNRHSETKQRKKQDRTDMGRKRVLVSCNCRDLSALHSYSSPS